MKTYRTHNDSSAPIPTGGTSYCGELAATYDQIRAAFGPPIADPDEYDDHKTDAEWAIEFDTPTGAQVATIYNWKNGRNYCGPTAPAIEQITDWHIGGHHMRVCAFVRDAIDAARQALKDYGPQPDGYTFNPARPLFRSLTPDEAESFREYARENDPPADPSILHPVCTAEWFRLGKIPNDPHAAPDPDQMLHRFATPFGMPPDTDTPPLCGAVLTRAYDFPRRERPQCAECNRIAAEMTAAALQQQ